jgi:hypothetical protein
VFDGGESGSRSPNERRNRSSGLAVSTRQHGDQNPVDRALRRTPAEPEWLGVDDVAVRDSSCSPTRMKLAFAGTIAFRSMRSRLRTATRNVGLAPVPPVTI